MPPCRLPVVSHIITAPPYWLPVDSHIVTVPALGYQRLGTLPRSPVSPYWVRLPAFRHIVIVLPYTVGVQWLVI